MGRRVKESPYPNNSIGRAEEALREYEALQAQAKVLFLGKFFGWLREYTPEQEEILAQFHELEQNPPSPPKRIPMIQGLRHKRMYGDWRHHFFGSGPFAFLRQQCSLCTKVKVISPI